MYMSNADIVADYRQAKTPMKQIAILADMNQCDRKEIIEILREAGCELPKQYQKKPKTDPKTEPEPGIPMKEFVSEQCKESIEAMVDDDDTINASEAIPLIIRCAAVEVIRKLLGEADGSTDDAVDFREQVRGVIELVAEVERRSEETGHDNEVQ